MTTVTDLYTQVLGRQPDAGGLDYWTGVFGSDVSPAELATFMGAAKAELANRTPEEQQVLAPKLLDDMLAEANKVTTTSSSSSTSAAPTSYLDDKSKTYAGRLELSSPDAYAKINDIISRAVNKDYGGKSADWMYEMFGGLDPSITSGIQKSLQMTPARTETRTGYDGESGTTYTYQANIPAELKQGQAGIEPVYSSGDENTPSAITGYRQKIDSGGFENLYANYDANGNLTGYSSNNRIYVSDPQWYGAQWDPTGKATPVSGYTSSGGGLFGGGGFLGTGINWSDIRDTLESAGVVAGNYLLPGSSLLTSQLVSEGAKEQLNTDLGKIANIAAGVTGGIQGNAANYGKIGEAAGITSGAAPSSAALDAQFISADASQLAAQGLSQAAIEQNLIAAGVDAFTAADAAQLALQGIKGTQLEGLLTQSSGGNPLFTTAGATTGGATSTPNTTSTSTTTNPLSNLTPTQAAQLAKTGISVAGLLAGGAAVNGITGGLTSGTGNLSLNPQNRAGIFSGSANYSPEYYQAIQSKYNQLMPNQPRDVTTELKNWYETKFAPKVA